MLALFFLFPLLSRDVEGGVGCDCALHEANKLDEYRVCLLADRSLMSLAVVQAGCGCV